MAATVGSAGGVKSDYSGVINAQALAAFVERIEGEFNRRDAVTDRLKIIYAEVKNAGLDVGIVREIVRERRMEPESRNSRYLLLEAYRRSLGMLEGTPLGDAAMARREAELNGASAVEPEARTRQAAKPRPFAEQPIKPPRSRGRPRTKDAGTVDDALDKARRHLGDPSQGNA